MHYVHLKFATMDLLPNHLFTRSENIETLIWVTGQAGNNQQMLPVVSHNPCDNLLRVKVIEEPNGFNNEALLILSLIGPRNKFDSRSGMVSGSVAIQLIPCNVELTSTIVQGNQLFDMKFHPCLKKVISGADGFLDSDGPIFTISSDVAGFDNKNDEVILGR